MDPCYLLFCFFYFLTYFNKVQSVNEIRINSEPRDFYGFPLGFQRLQYDVSPSNCKFQWHHNGTILKSGDKYVLQDEDIFVLKQGLETQGIYQLYITSDWGKIFGREIKVEFTITGKFAKGKEEVKDVTIGQSYRLPCPKHSFSRNFVYKWGSQSIFQGTTFFANNQENALVLSDGTLFFSNVKEDDVATIQSTNGVACLLEFGYEQDTRIESSSVFELNIVDVNKTVFGPELLDIPDQLVDTGKHVIFRCIAAGYPTPTYQWQKMDKDGKRSFVITNVDGIFLSNKNKILTINEVRERHEATYICIAKRGDKTVEKHSVLTVKARPTWVDGSHIKSAQPNILSKHVWTCLAKGDPQPEYKWYANTTVMKNQSGRYTIEGGILTFHQLTLQDNGMYQCVAKNKYGFAYQTVSMDVKYQRPVITKLDKETTLIVKKKGVIVCEAEAIPHGVGYWFYNDAMLVVNNTTSKYEIRNRTNLVIHNVSDNDAGEYTCVVENMCGKMSKKTTVKIGEIRFTIRPKDQTNVKKGEKFTLGCKAVSDPPLNIRYKWRFNGEPFQTDGSTITKNKIFIWKSKHSDSGKYECIAFITEPIYAENVSSADVIIRGVPDPPENLTLGSTCSHFEANLTWGTPYKNKYDPLKYLQLQWSMSHDEDTWYNISQRLEPTRQHFVVSGLNPWSKISFRILAVNDHGMGLPSEESDQNDCVTPGAKPTKCPDNVKGTATQAATVEITWKDVAYIHRNGPGFNYVVSYRKPGEMWRNASIEAGPNPRYLITNAGIDQEWEFTVNSNNSLGTGPECASVKARSEKEAPSSAPKNFRYQSIGANFVVLAWQEVKPDNNVVLGYKLSYWQASTRRRRAINLCNRENEPCQQTIPGSNTTIYKLRDLLPFRMYSLQLQAYNNGGDGPKTSPLVLRTAAARPSAPTKLKITKYGKYIQLEWQEPLEPNGKITGYNVAIKGKNMNGPRENQTARTRYLFKNLTPNSDYEVMVEARNSAGISDKVEKFTKTTAVRVPAIPKAPEVYGATSDSVNVTFIPGNGDGGFQEYFYVKYKVKGEEDEELKSSIKTKIDENGGKSFVVIEDLESSKMYLFATIVTNDDKKSEMSDYAEGQPLSPAGRKTTPIYKRFWFYIIIAVILLILLIILLILFLKRKPKETYKVSEREKKHAAKNNDDYPLNAYDQDDNDDPQGKMYGAIEPTKERPVESNGSIPALSNEPFKNGERDSLDDYDGEDDDFSEHGSYIGQYGPGVRTKSASQSSFSNFV